jgi:hypothetical protein
MFEHYALASTFLTDDAYHCSPRAAVMPPHIQSVRYLMQ